MLNIKLLSALQGDCIILEYGEKSKTTIIIDGGMGGQCVVQLKKVFQRVKENNQVVSLLVLTHIDHDHIYGIKKVLSDKKFDFSIINTMWFNYGKELYGEVVNPEIAKMIRGDDESTKISFREANTLEDIVKKNKVNTKIVYKNDTYEVGEAKITLLAPTIDNLKIFYEKYEKECKKSTKVSGECDYKFSVEDLVKKEFEGNVTKENRSSIAFIFEYKSSNFLFLGDAASDDLESSLIEMGYSEENRLDVTCCKISHHASKHNTADSFLKLINCSNYLVSTNVTSDGRPSKECLSRIVYNSKKPVKFYCNYRIDINKIFTKEEIEKYKMEFIFMNDTGFNWRI